MLDLRWVSFQSLKASTNSAQVQHLIKSKITFLMENMWNLKVMYINK